MSFSNAWKWKVKVKSLSRVWLLATPWTAAYQAPPPMGFSRQEYWSGVPLPSLNHLLSTVYSVIPLLFHCSVCLFLAQQHTDFNYYGSIMTSDCWEGKLSILIFCKSVLSVIDPLLFHENFRNPLSFPWGIMQVFWFYFLWIYRLICQESIYLHGFIFFTLCGMSLKLLRSYFISFNRAYTCISAKVWAYLLLDPRYFAVFIVTMNDILKLHISNCWCIGNAIGFFALNLYSAVLLTSFKNLMIHVFRFSM